METVQVFYAGFWIRFLAHIIDQIVLGIVSSFIYVPIIFIFGLSVLPFNNLDDLDNFSAVSYQFETYDDQQSVAVFAAFIFSMIIIGMISMILHWLYYTLMESSSKQATLGKMALGLKVTDEAGKRITFGRASGRYFSKIISGLVFMIGYIIAGFTQKKQALHDMIAGTLVIRI